MLRAILCRKSCNNNNKNNLYVSSYNKPDLCNDYISKEQGSNDRFCINIPRLCLLGHVLSNVDPLDGVDSWKKIVRPTKKPRSVDQHKSKPIQTIKKTINNKKIQQKNKKSRSVTIQIPEDHGNNNKEPRSDNTQSDMKLKSDSTPNDPISTISDIHELRSDNEMSTPQRITSVTGHPKNRLYIDSGASLHILFNKKLLGGLHNIANTLKI